MSDERLPESYFSEPSPALEELFLQLETLKQSNNIPGYISLSKQILQLLSREDDPSTWAALQFALGYALQQNQEGNRKAQLAAAIACYDSALTVYTREEMPTDWARIQHNKGVVLHELAGGLTGLEREKMLRDAITGFGEIRSIEDGQLAPSIKAPPRT